MNLVGQGGVKLPQTRHTDRHAVAPVTLTLIHKHELDMLKMYLHTKNKVSRSMLSKMSAPAGQTDTQTDATELITMPHLHVVTMNYGDLKALCCKLVD